MRSHCGNKTDLPNLSGKRVLDLILAIVLVPILSLPMLVIAIAVLICDGRPILYRSERMRTPDKSFYMWKFRTMRLSKETCGVSGGATLDRVIDIGHFLRASRLDELPQLWNILRGDMSFVGPRPPLQYHVEKCPEFYIDVLKLMPGVTGLASVVFYEREERILRKCRSVSEAEQAYCNRCIPSKARLDLIYQKNRTLWLDLWIIWKTCGVVFERCQKRMLNQTKPNLPIVTSTQQRLKALES